MKRGAQGSFTNAQNPPQDKKTRGGHHGVLGEEPALWGGWGVGVPGVLG